MRFPAALAVLSPESMAAPGPSLNVKKNGEPKLAVDAVKTAC
jgi:hypothetical protein